MKTQVYALQGEGKNGKPAAQKVLNALFSANRIPEDAILERTVLGKPYLKDYPNVQFNLSHSGCWGACALSETPVGVDIELVRPLRQQVARRFFTLSEQNWLAKRPSDEFFRLWTRKESFTKALGKGLTLQLDSFSVLEDILFWNGTAWYFHEYPIEGGFLTVCCQQTEAEFHVF